MSPPGGGGFVLWGRIYGFHLSPWRRLQRQLLVWSVEHDGSARATDIHRALESLTVTQLEPFAASFSASLNQLSSRFTNFSMPTPSIEQTPIRHFRERKLLQRFPSFLCVELFRINLSSTFNPSTNTRSDQKHSIKNSCVHRRVGWVGG